MLLKRSLSLADDEACGEQGRKGVAGRGGVTQPRSSRGQVPRGNREHRTGALHAFQPVAGSQVVMVPYWCQLHNAPAVVLLN